MPTRIISPTYRTQVHPGSCAVIAAINARIRLGGPDISEKELDALRTLAHCRHGAALRDQLPQVWARLGLSGLPAPLNTSWGCIAALAHYGLPVQFTVWHPDYGYHVTLAVDAVEGENGDRVRLLNLDRLGMGEWFSEGQVIDLTSAVPDHMQQVVVFTHGCVDFQRGPQWPGGANA